MLFRQSQCFLKREIVGRSEGRGCIQGNPCYQSLNWLDGCEPSQPNAIIYVLARINLGNNSGGRNSLFKLIQFQPSCKLIVGNKNLALKKRRIYFKLLKDCVSISDPNKRNHQNYPAAKILAPSLIHTKKTKSFQSAYSQNMNLLLIQMTIKMLVNNTKVIIVNACLFIFFIIIIFFLEILIYSLTKCFSCFYSSFSSFAPL